MNVLAPARQPALSRPALARHRSAPPPSRPTRSTRSPPRPARRWPPPACCTARRARSCSASSRSATSPGAPGCARTWARTGRCSSGPARAPTRCRRRRTTSRRCAAGVRARAGWRPRPATSPPRSPRRRRTTPARSARRSSSDSVSSGDAIVFLGGANLGAAAYEYGLAGLDARVPAPRARLVRRPTGSRASTSTDYYAVVEPDEVETIAFFADAIRGDRAARAGPVLRHRPDAPPRLPVRGPRVGDPPRRLPAAEPRRDRALARARRRTPTTGGRSSATRSSARAGAPDRAQLAQREELRARRSRGCCRPTPAIREPLAGRYGTVVSAYCADSATADRATWETYMRHIAGLVRPGRRLHHRGPAPVARLPRRRQALPERRRRRARPARGARAGVRLRDRGPRGARARAPRLRGHRARLAATATPTRVGSGSSLTPKRASTPAGDLARASASSSAVVPAPRLVSASVCLRRDRDAAGSPWPRSKPARSISQAAEVLTRPSGSGKRGGRAPCVGGALLERRERSASRIGLVKNEPAETVSGSAGRAPCPCRAAAPSTASRTSASGAPSPGSTPSVRASSA